MNPYEVQKIEYSSGGKYIAYPEITDGKTTWNKYNEWKFKLEDGHSKTWDLIKDADFAEGSTILPHLRVVNLTIDGSDHKLDKYFKVVANGATCAVYCSGTTGDVGFKYTGTKPAGQDTVEPPKEQN